MRRDGFTMTELLVVVAIMIIITGALLSQGTQARREAQMRDVLSTIERDLNQARSSAWRLGRSSSLVFDGSARYEIFTDGGASRVTRVLPGPARVGPAVIVAFNGPSGRLGTAATLNVTYSGSSRNVRLVGVLGEVAYD